jgi:hypothetical protein
MPHVGMSVRTADKRRVGATVALVSLLAVLGAIPEAFAGDRTLLVTRAAWVDSANNTGEMLFQGEIVNGTLTGRAYPGGGTELTVSGTVDANGELAGTLNDAEQELVATFTGELNGEQELVGDLYVTGALDAAWAAPADELSAE